MKHIKQAMIASAIGKVRAYEALQKAAVDLGDNDEADHLQKLIDEWRKILEDLLTD